VALDHCERLYASREFEPRSEANEVSETTEVQISPSEAVSLRRRRDSSYNVASDPTYLLGKLLGQPLLLAAVAAAESTPPFVEGAL